MVGSVTSWRARSSSADGLDDKLDTARREAML